MRPDERSPQAAQMADDSMLRTLAAQAEAIWPQERPLLERYDLAPGSRVLDIGCGPAEFLARLARERPALRLTGVDLEPPHLARARERLPGALFLRGDAFALPVGPATQDLVVCRHVLQAIPHPERALAAWALALRPGGWIHLLAEDYGMIHFPPGRFDTDRFWQDGPIRFGERTGTDLRSGRRIPRLLHDLGFTEVRADYLVIDTERVERAVFASIWRAWRDGYATAIAERTGMPLGLVEGNFEDMITALEEGREYACWMIPILSGRR